MCEETALRAVRIELTENVHKLLRREAAEQDKSLSELARQFVTDALTKRPKDIGVVSTAFKPLPGQLELFPVKAKRKKEDRA